MKYSLLCGLFGSLFMVALADERLSFEEIQYKEAQQNFNYIKRVKNEAVKFSVTAACIAGGVALLYYLTPKTGCDWAIILEKLVGVGALTSCITKAFYAKLANNQLKEYQEILEKNQNNQKE